MRQSQTCGWLIQPAVSGTVTLIVHWVSLKYGSSVVVYDNHNASGPILWDSGQAHFFNSFVGASATVPPPIISTGNRLYVQYVSNAFFGGTSYGFYAEYSSNRGYSHGVGSRSDVLAMSSAIDIMLPGNQATYPPNFNYTWRVKPHGIVSNALISFAASDVYLPNAGDHLTIYDGNSSSDPVLVQFLGTSIPMKWYQTSGQEALMVFRSNADSSYIGKFKVSYFTDGPNYHCGFTRNPATLSAAAMTLTDGSSSIESLYRNQHCEWVIESPDSHGIFLYFKRFSVMGGSLKIYKSEDVSDTDSTLLVVTIEDTLATPAPIFLPYAKVGLKYETSASATGGGFVAYYFRESSRTEVTSGPGDGLVLLTSSSLLSLGNFAQHGRISPHTNLSYHVQPVSTVSGGLYFSVATVNLTYCRGRVRIYDGPSIMDTLLGDLCGDQVPQLHQWIATSGAEALITFTSDASNDYYGDFDISYYSDGPNSHCGFASNPGRMTSDSMIFTDGSSSSETM